MSIMTEVLERFDTDPDHGGWILRSELIGLVRDLRADSEGLRGRIAELEAIIRSCFFVWEDPVDASVPRMGMHLNVSDAMCLKIIEICKGGV